MKPLSWSCGMAQRHLKRLSHEKLIKGFIEKYPNIKIERTSMQSKQIEELIKPALTSGEGPDLFFYTPGPGYVGVLSNAGLLADLGPYAEQFGWKDKFPQWTLDRATFNGELVGVGTQLEFLGVYYNKKMFKEWGVEVPSTYEEFLKICEIAKEKGVTAIGMDDRDQWPAFHLESVFMAAGVEKEKVEQILDKKGSFDQPKSPNH